ncbi:MAG: membrane protein insertase YidC [Nitrospirota bacterium]
MDKRAILFLVISMLILILYPFFLEKMGIVTRKDIKKKVKRPIQQQEQTYSIPTSDETVSEKPDNRDIVIANSNGIKEKEIIVETTLYKAVLTNRGGVIKRWELNSYYTKNNKDNKENVQLFYEMEGGINPLSISIESKDNRDKFLYGLYMVNRDDISLDNINSVGEIEFIYVDPVSKERLIKRLRFHNDSYNVDIDIQVEGIKEGYTIYLGSNFGIHDWGGKSYARFVGPTTLAEDAFIKDKPDKIIGEIKHEGDIRWTALQDKYFISALIPEGGGDSSIIRKEADKVLTSSISIKNSNGDSGYKRSFILYAGPKEYEKLNSFKNRLEENIDFGWFIYGSWFFVWAIAKPLFYVLRLFYQFTHNYGVSIILLTMLVKGAFTPLAHKSYKSMKAMQSLQPKIKELQTKFKDNKERLNKELMEIYKKNKVNPLGGCLPVFIQIPFFIALFNILNTTIELRQAPFMFWITDLSAKDPYYVLPIIMGITMFIQQKIQPTSMEPTQAKMMSFLPLVFTFLFINFPSGLVLYWLVNNLLTITQQYISMRYVEKSA